MTVLSANWSLNQNVNRLEKIIEFPLFGAYKTYNFQEGLNVKKGGSQKRFTNLSQSIPLFLDHNKKIYDVRSSLFRYSKSIFQ